MKPLLLLTALLLLTGRGARAHDLAENRVTLVRRDRNHVSVTLYLNYSQILHKALAPSAEYGTFLIHCSTMKPEDLDKELAGVQRRFESALGLQLPGTAGKLRLTGWKWPDAKAVQALLQRQVMQRMVEGHAHENQTEIHAEAVGEAEIVSLTARFPPEFGKVLVVSYRPSQVWVDSAEAFPPTIRF